MMSSIKKILLSVAGLGLAAGAVVGAGMAFFGLRFQVDGTGIRPIPYLDRTEKRLREIEQRAAVEHKAVAEQPAPVAAAAPAPAAGAPVSAPWPGFYGSLRDGVYREGQILTSWPAKGLAEAWRRPVGGGYASMAVAQGLVFTIEQRRDQEAATAYDLKSGREVWANSWKAVFRESMGGDGPRATPVWDDGLVYVLGAEGELRSLDGASGKLVWRLNILEGDGGPNLQWGMAASPLIVDGSVVVMRGRGLAAYSKKTGAPIWKALGEEKGSYTAPIVTTLNGLRQIVAVTAERAVGLTPDGAKILWEHPWKTEYDTNSALPLVAGPNRLILTAGYDHGAAMLEISAQGARAVWTSRAMKCKFNNAVLHEGVVYGLDEGILAAMDASTGQKRWKGGRYGYGQLLLAGDHLVVLTESGEVALVKASPERHEEIAKFSAIDGKTWNVPAMAEGLLLVRNTTEMACFRVGR